MRYTPRILALAFALTSTLSSSLALAGCVADPVEETTPQEIRPWRPYFITPQSLLANDVRIEGPDGLLEHLAVGHNPAMHTYTTETTPDGLLQVLELRPGVDGAAEPLRVQVDGLDMRIFQRVAILERVGQPPLKIDARGAVWWAREDGTGELRQERLVLPDGLPAEFREDLSAPLEQR
ncbi:MAG: hypothetical protein ACI8QS_001951 [Planctomycetota bacterium]|jgi:hypothetical protein